MAKYVEEIVNPSLFFLGEKALLGVARQCLLALNISAVPIVGEMGTPVGIIALRDLVDGAESGTVDQRMSAPVETIPASANIEEAGRRLAETGLHHLVVTNPDGIAVGIVSALDVIRGLQGLPVRFGDKLTHEDRSTGLRWRGDYALGELPTDELAASPGLIVIRYTSPGVPDVPVWVGMVDDLQRAVRTIVDAPADIDGLLAEWQTKHREHLLVRVAAVPDEEARQKAFEIVKAGSRVRAWARQIPG